MKNILLLLSSAIGFSVATHAQPWTRAQIDINQVNTQINSNGDLFWNYSTGLYEVPKDSGAGTLFAGATWIGGLDAGGNLHLAAQTYRQTGNDFYPGPVMNSASYTTTTDAQWNTVWKINKTTIDSFVLWSQNPSLYPGYTIPYAIASWPGNGDVAAGQAAMLAPFVDVNGDQIYDPQAGDYPCIKGDQALFVIYNDHRNVHTETGGLPMGVEIHAMMYAYSAPGSWLDSTIFINYKLYNRSAMTYSNVYWGNWNDFDLGSPFDDYVGSDVTRGIGYAYNGNANDGPTPLPTTGTYGANPPAQGITYLRGPEADSADLIDNDRDGITDEPGEPWTMTHFMYYFNDLSIMGNPVTAVDHYNYLSGFWKDGSPWTHGGNGYGGTNPTTFMYPGDSDPTGWATGGMPQPSWYESTTPSDRRGLVSSGPFTLQPAENMCIDVAYIFGRGNNGPQSSVSAMQLASDSAHAFYTTNNPCECDPVTVGIEEQHATVAGIYPNPVSDNVNIICGENSTGASVDILDATGRIVSTTTVLSGNSVVINTTALPAGIYFVRVQKTSTTLTGTFVKH